MEIWKKYKEKHNGNYSYKICFGSWTGYGQETEIIIKNDEIESRKYQEWNLDRKSQEYKKNVTLQWCENASEIGSHKQGAPAKNMEELYKEAIKILLTNLEKYQKLVLKFDEFGILKNCYYYDTNIVDDVPSIGIIISSLKLGE